MKTGTELCNLLEKLVTIPAGGVNIDEADIHYVLGECKNVKLVKKEFSSSQGFMNHMETLNISSFANAKGLLIVITADPDIFPDIHYSLFEQKLKRNLGRIGIPCCFGFYRTTYEKEKISLYLLISYAV